ncbi:hypothetical protein C9J01_04705 [Photobacterium rosenbergii]|uniref:Uncharacterized protein n=1 Tax=Photobacterium rosenbergii TaxID=294936 RepID=A0A2T3NLA2_9GAMM|nr:hypothetical protein C9J01_04705 [Photobacterium rosenbergii]
MRECFIGVEAIAGLNGLVAKAINADNTLSLMLAGSCGERLIINCLFVTTKKILKVTIGRKLH